MTTTEMAPTMAPRMLGTSQFETECGALLSSPNTSPGTAKTLSKRGIQLGGEFRYLEPKFKGLLEGEYLPHDRIAQRDRWFFGVTHEQQLWKYLTYAAASMVNTPD